MKNGTSRNVTRFDYRFFLTSNFLINIVARHGFEPRLQDPESRMIDHYTTGL